MKFLLILSTQHSYLTVKTATLITSLLTILKKGHFMPITYLACIHNGKKKRRCFCDGGASQYLLPFTAADLHFYKLIFYNTN